MAAVGPDQCDGGEPLPQQRQQWVGAVAVLDAGRGDEYREQQPESVDRDVPLPAVIYLPPS